MQRQLAATDSVDSQPTALSTGNFVGTGTTITTPPPARPPVTGPHPFPEWRDSGVGDQPGRGEDGGTPSRANQSTARRFSSNYFATGDLAFRRDNIDLKINYNPSDKTSSSAATASLPATSSIRQRLGPRAARPRGGQPGMARGLSRAPR